LSSKLRYFAFETATTLLKRSTIERIGVDASIVYARTEPHLRDTLLQKVLQCIEERGQPPTLMSMWGWVRALRMLPLPTLKEMARAGRH
jgi:hypothetical protein